MGCCVNAQLLPLLLALWAVGPLQIAGRDEDFDCNDHPGGCECYYDALRDGCPSSLGYDSKMMLCTCSYGNNVWLHVLTNFIWAFRTAPDQRHLLAEKFKIQIEADGVLSMDVGYTSRIQCGAPLANVYPGTKMELDVQELYSIAKNILYPEVWNKMNELCVPGRIALQLLCLHAELGRREGRAALAYTKQMNRLWQMVEGCADNKTPFPFPGLGKYLASWKLSKACEDVGELANDCPYWASIGQCGVNPAYMGLKCRKSCNLCEVPPEGELLSTEAAASLSWWPEAEDMRAKTPEESENHYWPCVPLKDPSCFPVGTEFVHASCEACCDPAKGQTGEARCFDGVFSFARCCNTPGGGGSFY